ncbi:class I SAM-dependent methyltransferase [Fimbriiglobus ruber]|nr:class I SAM-dependent methyltransferase [Fimbriiglobus ruber]
MSDEKKISIKFAHGFGDCSLFACAIPSWISRGWTVEVEASSDKACLFKAAGATIVAKAKEHHPYLHPGDTPHDQDDSWAGNKLGWNLGTGPMPVVGTKPELWEETVGRKLRVEAPSDPAELDKLIEPLGKFIAVHTRGNTGQGDKNFRADDELKLYQALLKETDCTLLLLDWDHRVSKARHSRIRHMGDHFKKLSIPDLAYVLDRAALLIGVDSGPLHFSRFTNVPTLGVWFNFQPARFALPRAETLHVAPSNHGGWTHRRRHSWNIVDGDTRDGVTVAKFAARLVAGEKPTDIVIEQLFDKANTTSGNQFRDRDRTFRAAFSEIKNIPAPVVVETGCIRAQEDWSAGYVSYLCGLWLKNHGGGNLTSVDITPQHVQFAKSKVTSFPVEVVCQGSVEWLEAYTGPPIDLLYLDSLDTDQPGYADHCLAEAKAAEPHLADNAVILIDDTFSTGTAEGYFGKGEKAVPYLVGRGWKIICEGYQVVLKRDNAA